MVMNVIMYICCYLSGLFVGTFIWTLLENISKGWRQLTRRFTRTVPWLFRRIIMWVMIIVTAYIGFFVVPWGYTRGGIFMGMAAGLFVYLKAGVTLGKSNMPETPKKGKNGSSQETTKRPKSLKK